MFQSLIIVVLGIVDKGMVVPAGMVFIGKNFHELVVLGIIKPRKVFLAMVDSFGNREFLL